jgi:hypothetical protein
MGLTIHYKLRVDVNDLKGARKVLEQLRQAALDLPMAEVGELVEVEGTVCDFRAAAQDDRLRWLLIQARRIVQTGERYSLVATLRAVAFSAWPGEGSEVANFGLAFYPETTESEGGTQATGLSGWSWESFCKTQYASNPDAGGVANFVRCHLAVIRLLDHAKAMGILESVHDEGQFWENRDVRSLVETVGQWNAQIAGLVGQFYDGLGGIIFAPIAEYPNFEHLEAEGRKPGKPRR